MKTAIVGAGPAGMICAAELERLGEEVVVLEKNKKVGENPECAGLFNIGGIERLGLKKGDYILNKVRGARFISASGAMAEIRGNENKAYVVDRGEFDRFVADQWGGKIKFDEDGKTLCELIDTVEDKEISVKNDTGTLRGHKPLSIIINNMTDRNSKNRQTRNIRRTPRDDES